MRSLGIPQLLQRNTSQRNVLASHLQSLASRFMHITAWCGGTATARHSWLQSSKAKLAPYGQALSRGPDHLPYHRCDRFNPPITYPIICRGGSQMIVIELIGRTKHNSENYSLLLFFIFQNVSRVRKSCTGCRGNKGCSCCTGCIKINSSGWADGHLSSDACRGLEPNTTCQIS